MGTGRLRRALKNQRHFPHRIQTWCQELIFSHFLTIATKFTENCGLQSTIIASYSCYVKVICCRSEKLNPDVGTDVDHTVNSQQAETIYWPVNYLVSATILWSHRQHDTWLGVITQANKGDRPFLSQKFVETNSLLKNPLVCTGRKNVLSKRIGWNVFAQMANVHNFKLFLFCGLKSSLSHSR